MTIKDTVTPAAPAPSAPNQQSTCADADLMRHADATRSAYFAKVRRDVALECGEVA